MNDLLVWLQEFYFRQCNGDWEHIFGVKIGTLDNPGWLMDISLEETEMEAVTFDPIKIERSEHDWVICRVEKKKFLGDGGPRNLIELLTIFKNWVDANQPVA